MDTKRPLITVVCAYYNGEKTIRRVLDSIVNQNMFKEDLEVVIVDDCSTHETPFGDPEFKNYYFDKLNLHIFKTDHNHGYPGPVRELAVEQAHGEWLTIIDQDDAFVEDVFKSVLKEIKENNVKHYFCTNFFKVEMYDNTVTEMIHQLNWNHGKFYNLDFWRKYKIHYREDMISHEDIYISSQVNCILNSLKEDFYLSDIFTYKWIKRPDSVSNSSYSIEQDNLPHEYMEKFFGDYFKSTGYCYIERYRDGMIDRDYAIAMVIQVLIYGYFYMQKFMFHHKDIYIVSNLIECSKYVRLVKSEFGLTNQFIYDYCAANEGEFFESTRAQAAIATGPIIPQITFRGWLEIM